MSKTTNIHRSVAVQDLFRGWTIGPKSDIMVKQWLDSGHIPSCAGHPYAEGMKVWFHLLDKRANEIAEIDTNRRRELLIEELSAARQVLHSAGFKVVDDDTSQWKSGLNLSDLRQL